MAKPPNLKDRLALHATPRPAPPAPPPVPPPTPPAAADELPDEAAPPEAAALKSEPKASKPPARSTAKAKTSRVGKVQVAGYFSPEMATALRILAAERRTTVQALMGEGFDAVLRQYGKHPFGER